MAQKGSEINYIARNSQIVPKASEKEKRKVETNLPLRLRSFPALLSLAGQDLTAIVVAASLASSVGHDGLTALGANGNAGSGQLPVGATARIAAGLGHFTLRNSH